MSTHFRIEMLPARHGDCIWIEYGDPQKTSRLLIDGGTAGTYKAIRKRLKALKADQRYFELLIVTHIDIDHINGILKLLGDQKVKVSFDDIWFNGWRHLPGSRIEDFGPVEGEMLTLILDEPALPWNGSLGEKAVSVSDAGPLPVHTLPGGMKLTLLSPGAKQLKDLRPIWKDVCEEAGLDPAHKPPKPLPDVPSGLEPFGPPDVEALADTEFECDPSLSNASSIAVLAEFEGRRVLLTGDAHADVLLAGIKRVKGLRRKDRLKLDAFKLPHHGSKANIDKHLLAKIDCARYLFSTNGGGKKKRHPNEEAVARIIKFGGAAPELIFNYRTEYNKVWDDNDLMDRYNYTVSYPGGSGGGKSIEL